MDDSSTAPGASARRAVIGIRRYMWIAFIAVLTISVAELAVFATNQQSRDWVARSRDIARTARAAQLLAVHREALLRLYAVSHDDALLTRESSERTELHTALDSLETLTIGRPAQQRHVREIARVLDAWENSFAEPVRARRAVTTAASEALFEPIRLRMAEFIAGEDATFDEQLHGDEFSATLTVAGTLLPLLVLALVFVALGRRVGHQSNALFNQQRTLEEQAMELESQIERLEAANREQRFAVASAEEAREQARRETMERARATAMLDAALASAPLGFAFVDRDQRCVQVNRALAALRGVSAEAIVGATIPEALPQPLATAVAAQVADVLDSHSPRLNVRVESATVAGQQQSWIVSCYPVLATGNDLLGVGVMVLDVTDRAELEEQIRQSQKMEAIGRLAGGVAHDFNNLLTVIRSYCDLVLLETLEADPRHEELLEIRSAADRAATLARQLLTFSRKQVLVPKILDLNEVVTGLESMVSRVLSERVRRELHLGSALHRVKADPGHIEQVLLNLVINAADAMPDGGRLTISTENVTLDDAEAERYPDAAPGEYVMISVTDTGTGMDDATLNRLFEPFFTTKPPGKGTGLGLSTVYGIVKQAGGYIRVTTAPGRGTTFRVCLPQTRDEPVASARSAAPGPVQPQKVATILIVDDEAGVRTTLSRILERDGHATLEAAHGGAAMRLAKEHPEPIDLVISDLMMPGMNGREFVERFSGLHPESRVLFMSGYTDDAVLTKDLSKEQSNFIEKPFTVEQITRKVRDALERD